jgi:HlyD family secretion protein
MKKIVIPISVLVIIVILIAVYLVRRGRGDIEELILSGTAEAVEVNLAFKTGGRVDYIMFDEGDRIAAGDTISELTHREIEARIRQARDKLDALEANRKSLSIQRETASRNLRKIENLIPSGGATVGQREDTEDRIREIEASIDAAGSSIEAAKSEIEYLRIMYENEFLVAPINGAVLLRLAEPGEIVNPGQTILTMADVTDLEIRVYLPEKYLGRIKTGQEAEISVDSHPERTFGGSVSRISEKAEFTPKNVQTRQERVKTVYAITVSTSDHDGIIKPGMPCDVRLNLNP